MRNANVLQREWEERDVALPQNLSISNPRQRIMSFERCRHFAAEMTRQAQRHETSDRISCDPCHYPDLHGNVPDLENGLRDRKNHFFFAQFTCDDEILWQGFLPDHDSQTDSLHPVFDLINLNTTNEEQDMFTEYIVSMGYDWIGKMNGQSDIRFHLDASNVNHNVTRDHVTRGLRVTLVSWVLQQGSAPKLQLHYSAKGFRERFGLMNFPDPDNLPSIDMLSHQYERHHDGHCWNFVLPIVVWKSKCSLHSISFSYFLEEIGQDEVEDLFLGSNFSFS
ncbi:hypothetical protein FisN_12Hh080 [Fistulifera solaris]|uniref:Uncharacterized protein n=1 Tax=Fistulifera solaris TaxID=1519565 RepID=A0A1Z5K2E1_FISSO|nr:hypothetical protein FisN_12Hh080 [Fistulifera solaris]|eukprot:GAX20231.1 hypothetical protein FisN_12Hh080 [Fistulifera solaris]